MQIDFQAGQQSIVGVSSSRIDLQEILGIRSKLPGVAKNKLGITNAMELIRYEATVTSATIPAAIRRLKNAEHWGLKQWRLAHQVMFSPVYDWAGTIRTVNIKKHDTFVDKDSIERKTEEIFSNFYKQHAIGGNLVVGLRSLSQSAVSTAFADLYSDLTMVHPFREGNGRSLKIIVTAMARQADYNFDWAKISGKKWDFDEACKSAASGKPENLRRLFSDIIEPLSHSEPELSRKNLTRKAKAVMNAPRL